MHTEDDLTEEQLAELRADLIALRAELDASIHAAAEAVKPVDLDSPIGRLSRVDAIQGQQLAAATRARNQTRLKQVANALHRLDEDAFGECARCEEPIGYKRLKARPESTTCMNCLREIESKRSR
jgi:DnaK suppressor protein